MKTFCYNSLHSFVFGHSMGSLASLDTMKNHPNSFEHINFSKFIMMFHYPFSLKHDSTKIELSYYL